MTRIYTRLSLAEYQLVISSSASFAEVARRTGRSPVGGTLTAIALYCKRHNIDTSHMTGQLHNKGKSSSRKKLADELLVLGSNIDYRTKPTQLRRALAEIGVPYLCKYCGISDWKGSSLMLEIDHIDGQYWNNVRDNLQYLCPNCHSVKTYIE